MSQEIILVTRAAGGVCSTAQTAIAVLLEQGHRVRATVRKLDAQADSLRDMGAETVVGDMTLSQMSETESTSSPQQKQHWLAEQMLRWSGLPVVYLRPTAFFDGILLVQGAKGIRENSAIRLPFGDGKTALIAGADVGAAAAAVLANPAPHIGKVYDLTGVQSLTMAQYAQAKP